MLTIIYKVQNTLKSEFTINRNTVYNASKNKVKLTDLPFYLPAKDKQTIEESILDLANSTSNQVSLENSGTGIFITKQT